MLYKKYHRNFIRKFKKGTRFKFFINDDTKGIMYVVNGEPFINLFKEIFISVIKIDISDLPIYTSLIYSNGSLSVVDIKLIEYVI